MATLSGVGGRFVNRCKLGSGVQVVGSMSEEAANRAGFLLALSAVLISLGGACGMVIAAIGHFCQA